MKFYSLFLFIPLTITLTNCNLQKKSNYKYSQKESISFLDEIVKNAKLSIGDFTKIEKQPTDKLYLYTRYPISKTSLEEFNKNNGTIVNKDDDIWDFATYIFKKYELINEKDEKVYYHSDSINLRTIHLQEYSLWDYNNVLCQNLGIKIKLNKKYEKLKGYVVIEFKMPDKVNKEVKFPVNITIYDEEAE
ncbi:hypothetical protein [Aquimarina algiphila]|uniref:hypothetical protein n=1 Tax=Aquimarina algiphila TaxID=2047982 RepID=UPI00232C1C2E|nr:hypothetical protein [Aquimarina algiphila]